MLADIHPRFTSGLFGRAGSFWTSSFAEKDRALQLVELMGQNRVIQDFSRGLNRLAARPPASDVVAQRWLFFEPSEVIATGAVDLDDPLLRLDDNQRTATLDAKDIRYWGIPLESLLPLRIQAGYQSFTLGVDFFASANQKWLLFRRNPAEFAPEGRLLVSAGRRLGQPSWWSYLLQVEVSDTALPHVIDYVRNHQTPAQFERALAAVAGLTLLPAKGELRHISTNGSRTTYLFDRFTLKVGYKHTLLEVGKTYPKHFIVGDGVKVHQANPNKPGTDWWKAVQWGPGMVLDPIIRDPKLKLLNSLVPAYATGSYGSGVLVGRMHVRFQLSGDFWSEAHYWQEVGAREELTGQYLNEFVGLESDDGTDYRRLLAATEAANQINTILRLPREEPAVGSLPNIKLVNPLDLLFQTVLGVKAYVVELRPHHCPNSKALRAFLKRYLPLTGTPIVFEHAPDLPVETLGGSDTMRFHESMTVADTNDADWLQAVTDRLPLENFVEQVAVN